MTAAVNPSTKMESMLFGYRKVDGETSTPASAPMSPASAQPRVSMRPTRTPSSRATGGLNADARSCSPAEVYRNPAASSSAAASTATATNTSLAETPSAADPTCSPVMENAAGNDRNWPP